MRPLPDSKHSADALLHNLGNSAAPVKDDSAIGENKSCIVTQTTYDGNMRCDIDVSHID